VVLFLRLVGETMSNNRHFDKLIEAFHTIVTSGNQDLVQENANVDGRSPMGQLGKFGSEGARLYANMYLLSPIVRKAIEDNLIYPHDLDFYVTGTTTCSQIPLGKLLKGGFNTGHGHMREPTDIKSALALASIILQANQNMQHGGQAYPMFDVDLAPYVRKTYEKNKRRLEAYPSTLTITQVKEIAWNETDGDVYQACEAFIHNSNSMHSRGGGQVPFISVNYGTDTSREGRMLTKNLLLATQVGLGNGETPIFPIQIFKVKKGVNFEKEDKNYDLYCLALETTSKRLFPNFAFIDAPFNLHYYKGTHESEVCYMGCRTRIMGNIHGEENAIGRGNLSFTSINLVKIALISDSKDAFFRNLDWYIDITIQQLVDRYKYQASKLVVDFKFLYRQGVWNGSENFQLHESVREIIKQGSLSMGFIGLAECLVALVGKHHGEAEEALQLGIRIIKHMRARMDIATRQYELNFSLIATPAEGLCGKFTRRDREFFGSVEGITNRAYYTNSFHVPVYYKIKAIDKIRIEGNFHQYCNAGHITYVEVDGNVTNNIEALDAIVRAMARNNIGYGSINHPVDKCTCCGYKGMIENQCPACSNEDQATIERIRRITGYLVGDVTKWNTAKRKEEAERVKHS
jgi:ribonucleoside-triphosphate reductase (formate)